MTDLETRIRMVLRGQAAAMPVPGARPNETTARLVASEDHGWKPWLAAAAAILVLVGGFALLQRQTKPIIPAQATPLHFETPTVLLTASAVEVSVGGRTFAPTSNVEVHSDPGTPNEYTTLELTWHEGDIEQRINIYFASDGTDWWASEIRTYDGQSSGNWVEPIATGEFFKSPLGTAFTGDFDLSNLHLRGLRLEAFRRPAACDSATTPMVLISDYPVIESSAGAYGASLQVLETDTCRALPVAQFTFEYTSLDPAVAAVSPGELIPGYPTTKTRLGLQLGIPGATSIQAVARNVAGDVVGTTTMQVRVNQLAEGDAPIPTSTTVVVTSTAPPG